MSPVSRSTVEAELRPALETATGSEDYLTDDELAQDDDDDDNDDDDDADREAEAADESAEA